jgi:hypothetical protein
MTLTRPTRVSRIGGGAGEDELLTIPQVQLAVHGAQTRRIEDGGAVVDVTVIAALAEATGEHQVMAGGEAAPFGEQRIPAPDRGGGGLLG